MKREHFKSGFRQQPKDDRDHVYSPRFLASKVKKTSNLSIYLPVVFDQGQTASCGGHMGAEALMLRERIATKNPAMVALSRLEMYFLARKLNHDELEDAGVYIRNVMKAGQKFGCCIEGLYTLDNRRFTEEPSSVALADGLKHKAPAYQFLPQSVNAARDALSAGTPVCFGMTVYNNFFDIGPSGMMPKPAGGIAGGHAVLLIGHSDTKKAFRVRNSWGPKWGAKGDFWMPYSIWESDDVSDAAVFVNQ